MSATDEVTEMNTFNGANVVTRATSRTLRIVNYGEIILNLDCSLGTGLLALHTADAGISCRREG